MALVRDIDKGFRAIVRNFRRHRRGAGVTVGVQGAEASENREGITNAELATIHEFGSRDGTIPQRSFIRSTIDRERKKYTRMLDKAVFSATRRGDAAKRLGQLGVVVVSDMVKTIDQSIGLAPNKEQTIAGKGSTKPLIDTGVLKASITHKVHI